MGDDLLKLKWNRHDITFCDVFKIQRDKPIYADVTLFVDGKCFEAHKFVLGTCSDYFKEIFEKTSCQRPVIVLQETSIQIMEYILDYMYIGEVNIKQKELNYLLKTAESLRIKGLATTEDITGNSLVNQDSTEEDCNKEPPNKKLRLDKGFKISSEASSQASNNHASNSSQEDEFPLLPIVKMEQTDEDAVDNGLCQSPEMSSPNSSLDKRLQIVASTSNSSGIGEELNQDDMNGDSHEMVVTNALALAVTGKEAQCTLCPAVLANQNLLRRHLEDHHFQIRKYYCKHCQKKFKRKEHKERHERIHTGEKPFVCSLCPSRFTQKEHLKGHVENVHMKHKLHENNLRERHIEPKPRESIDAESGLPMLTSASAIANWMSTAAPLTPGTILVPTTSKINRKSTEGKASDATALYAPVNRKNNSSPSKHVQKITLNFN